MKSSVLAGVCALMMTCSGWKKSELTDITKPYLGEYECKQAMMGERDYLEKFDYIRLELKGNGRFVLSFCEEDKEKQTVKGTYEYDKDAETLTLKMGGGGLIRRKFPFKDGELYITMRVGIKTLSLKFEQK